MDPEGKSTTQQDWRAVRPRVFLSKMVYKVSIEQLLL